MANQEHLNILEQGVDAWNGWRKEHRDIRPDLSEADFRGALLSRAKLSRLVHIGDLLYSGGQRDANLGEADFRGALLSRAKLRGALLSGALLSGADLSGADLSGANLNQTNLSGANLSGANLNDIDLSEADLSEADLSGADLSGANLSGANLSGANLSGKDLSRVILTGKDLVEAILYGKDLGEDYPSAYDLGVVYDLGEDYSSAYDLGLYDLGEDYPSAYDPSAYDVSYVHPSEVNHNVNLSGANLSGANLSGANLSRKDLSRANLSRANLSGVDLRGKDLSDANLSGANLSGVDLSGVDLRGKDLSGANLSGANLSGADLSRITLDGAILSKANLSKAIIIEANLKNAVLSSCSIYGIAAWDVQLEGAKQEDLVITPPDDPTITVDNLEVAQFIYLLLNNQKIRDVIDTITSKVVLILGRFTPEREAVLDALRDELRKHNYSPVLFDFDKPASRDLTETVSTLAHLARFIIVDLTDPSSAPHEVATVIPQTVVPVQPLLTLQPLNVDGKAVERHEYAMFNDLRRRYPWVLPTFRYHDTADLLASLKERIIDPAEQKAKELNQS